MVLGIYGAGGLGREVKIIANKINQIENRWNKIIFIDDNKDIKRIEDTDVYVFEDLIRQTPELEVVIGIGEPAIREKLYDKVTRAGISLATLIHPSVSIDSSTNVGKGVVICNNCTITSCVELEDNIYIQPHTVIGHDIKIGKHSVISALCHIGGTSVLGERVFMGFMSGTLQGLNIGDDVILSAGSILFRDVDKELIIMGNPARPMKKNERKRALS